MKFGRLPRKFDPRVPHFSTWKQRRRLPEPPPLPPFDEWTVDMPADFGMMGNDRLGDCTCAAAYHAIQVWSWAARKFEVTEPDTCVVQMYEEACGYNPQDPASDRGGVLQEVLSYWLKTGIPILPSPAPRVRQKLLAFAEIDPRNLADVREAIYDCGVCYIGFEVPAYLMQGGPPAVWDVNPAGDPSIVGGHAVVLTGYDMADGSFGLVSWGARYRMTSAFFARHVDEAYALVDPTWVETTSKTPLGMTPAELEAQMQALARPA